jgi:hypothetical protein
VDSLKDKQDTRYGIFTNEHVGIVTSKIRWEPTIERWGGTIIVMWKGEVRLLSDVMEENGHVKQAGDIDWSK